MALLDRMVAAYRSDGQSPCPITEKPREGVATLPVPPELHGVVCVWQDQKRKVEEMNDNYREEDGPRWNQASSLREALRCLLEDALRERFHLSSRHHFEWWSEYRFSFTGPPIP